MYKIVQYRETLTSKDDGNILGRSNRIKEARGMAKTQFLSHLEMLVRHNFFCDDFVLDEVNWSLQCLEDGKITYSYRVEIQEDG